MRWEGERESTNVEDRRGGGGGGFGIPVRGRGIGLGTVAIALVAGWIFGINPLTLLGMFAGGGGPVAEAPTQAPAARTGTPDDTGGRFASVVLASTEDVWTRIFQQAGARYEPPPLVLYSGRTRTACGLGEAAAGPFYCPGDRKVYVDLDFYQILKNRLGAPGDAAQAYVIAHEVGHHVQNLTGTMNKIEAARRQMSEAQYNQVSVRLELQADCYAGIWAYHSQQAKRWLDAGDIEQAINAAAAVGDDRLQRQSQGMVRPETFTHGSSAQRVRWFKTGAQSGDINQCDTFSRNAG
ncbi:MAG: neutral zinc metallopeptidase [Burkholderiaceae bacterium]